MSRLVVHHEESGCVRTEYFHNFRFKIIDNVLTVTEYDGLPPMEGAPWVPDCKILQVTTFRSWIKVVEEME